MILKGVKVTLRPVRLDDAPRFVKWFNDPEVNKFLFYRSLTLSQERKIIREKLQKQTKQSTHFCIDTKSGVHIGVTSFDSIRERNKNATWGIVIGDKRYWSQGYGTEAMSLMFEYGFKKLKLHRIEFDVYRYNKRAIGLYKKLGCKIEGIKREHNFWNGKYWDTYQMGILDKEWKG
ncbi:MAG: GNAT family protein [Candidatus Doudnabacteria bacterium]|nr:GNAT family protein [Candidatus Doudnabacteria bacterium]